MTFTLHLWLVVGLLTAAIWTAAFFWPLSSSRGGDYYFGRAFEAMLHLAAAVFATLVLWLAYFAWLTFGGAA